MISPADAVAMVVHLTKHAEDPYCCPSHDCIAGLAPGASWRDYLMSLTPGPGASKLAVHGLEFAIMRREDGDFLAVSDVTMNAITIPCPEAAVLLDLVRVPEPSKPDANLLKDIDELAASALRDEAHQRKRQQEQMVTDLHIPDAVGAATYVGAPPPAEGIEWADAAHYRLDPPLVSQLHPDPVADVIISRSSPGEIPSSVVVVSDTLGNVVFPAPLLLDRQALIGDASALSTIGYAISDPGEGS